MSFQTLMHLVYLRHCTPFFTCSEAFRYFLVFSLCLSCPILSAIFPLCCCPLPYNDKNACVVCAVSCFMHQRYTFRLWHFGARFLKYELERVRKIFHPVIHIISSTSELFVFHPLKYQCPLTIKPSQHSLICIVIF